MPALITSEFHFTTEDIGAVIDLDPYQAGNTAIDEGLVVNSDTGGIEIEGGGSIRGGLSDFDDTTDQGFFFGFDQNTLAHVATIGDPSNENLTWNGDDLKLDIDGSNLTVNGGTTGQGLVVASDGTVTFVDLVNVLNDLSDVNASPSVGQFLKWSGTQWTHSNITNILGIGDMTDVVISTVATDNILKYNGTNWVNVAPSALGASLVLNDLSNVNASPSVGQFLKWSGTEWSHSNITNILGIGDMTDVVISTVATDNILKYNGTNWVNVAPSTLASSISGSIALDDLSNVTNTSLADDQILVYNAASGGIPARWSNQSVVAVADNIKLRHLDDVSYVDGSPTLTNNKYLKYNGTTWVADDVSLALNDLSNVSVSSPSTGQFLKWNGTSWSASNVTGVLELNDLSGVTITSVATDNILKYNGTNWVNTALSLNDLSGINLGTLPPTTPVVTGTAVPVLAYEASSSQWKATVLELDDLYGVPVPTVEGSILYVSDETHAEEFLWSTNFKMVGGTSATAFPEATDTFTVTSDLFAGPSIVLNNENSGMTAASNYHYGSIKFNGNDSGTGANGIRGSIVGDSVGLNGALDLVFSTAADSATVQEAMRIDASGNVGIGTSDPGSLLELEATGSTVFNGTSTDGQSADGTTLAIQNLSDTNNTFSQILFRNRNTSKAVSRIASLTDATGTEMAFVVENNGSPAEVLRLEKTGNVGIGRTNPSSYVTDATSLYVKGQIRVDGVTNTAALPALTLNDTNSGLFAPAANEIAISTGAAERLRITSGGILEFNDNAVISVNDTADSMYIGGGGTVPNTIQNQASALHNWQMGGSNAMRLDASGNLLVGTTNANPAANNVTGHALKAGGLAEHANSGAMVMRLNRTDSDGSLIEFRQGTSAVGSIGASSGDLIIGTGDTGLYFWDGDDSVIPWNIDTNSSRDNGIDLGNANHRFKDLHLSGTVLVGTTLTNPTTGSDEGIALGATGIMLASNANDAALAVNRVSSNGDVVIYKRQGVQVGSVSVSGTNATFNTSSDQRLKENIIDAPSASDDIDAIQVRSFDWKADGSHQKYGMVAQELNTVAPEAVSEGATEEDMMGVDYSKLVPMLVKEIQSLRARVAQLETN